MFWKFYSFKRHLRAMFSGLLGYDLLRSGLACCYVMLLQFQYQPINKKTKTFTEKDIFTH